MKNGLILKIVILICLFFIHILYTNMYANKGRNRNVASLQNQNQGGGEKKAGLPGTFGNSDWKTRFLAKTSQNYAVLKVPEVPTTNMSRTMGMSLMYTRAFRL